MAGKIFIADIRDRLRADARSFSVQGMFLVFEKQVPRNKNGTPYLSMVLKDKDGTINAKMWDNVEETERREALVAGDFIKVEGEAQTYRGSPQLKINKLSKVTVTSCDDLCDFLGTSAVPARVMLAECQALLETLSDSKLRRLLLKRLDDKAFQDRLALSPAAKTNHHAHLGGLLEHTLSVMKLVDNVAAQYPRLDRDLLIAGAFLHDLGKIRELQTDSGFAYTDEGNLIGHVVMGMNLFTKWLEGAEVNEDIGLKLSHMILAHHGKKEFGSPVVPKFPEAIVLHLADNLDSKIKTMFEVADKEVGQRWSSYQQQFDSYLFLEGAQDCQASDETAAEQKPLVERKVAAELTHKPLAGIQDKMKRAQTQHQNDPALDSLSSEKGKRR